MSSWQEDMKESLGEQDLALNNFEQGILSSLKAAGLAPTSLNKLDLEKIQEDLDTELEGVDLKGSEFRKAQKEARKRPGTPVKIQGTNLAVIATPSSQRRLRGGVIKSD